MDTQKQIVERLQEANNVLLTVSKNPNVDQLAACIGLSLVFDKLDKHAAAVYSGHTPSVIEFLNPDENLEKNTDSLQDFIISLDKSKADKLRYKVEDDVVRIFITPYRTSINEKDLEYSQGDFNVDVVIAIGVSDPNDLDEAITNHGRILHDATVVTLNNTQSGELGTINWVDESASSVSEMATKIATQLGKDVLDEQNSTALLTGIVAETDRFSNEKTTANTMKLTASLLQAGANQQLVATKLEQPTEVEEIDDNDHGQDQGNPDSEGDEDLPQADVSDDGTLKIDHDAEEEEIEPAEAKEPEKVAHEEPEEPEEPETNKEHFDRERVGEEHVDEPPKEEHKEEVSGGGSITGGPHLKAPTKSELLSPIKEDEAALAEESPVVNAPAETLITPTNISSKPSTESSPESQTGHEENPDEEPPLPQLDASDENAEGHPAIKKEKRELLNDPNAEIHESGIMGVIPDDDEDGVQQPAHQAAVNQTILGHGKKEEENEETPEEHHEDVIKPIGQPAKKEEPPKPEPHDNEVPNSYNPEDGFKGGLKVQQEPTIKLPKAVEEAKAETKAETLAQIENRLGAVHKPPKHVAQADHYELDLSKLEQLDGSEGPAVQMEQLEEEAQAKPPADGTTLDDARNAVAAAVGDEPDSNLVAMPTQLTDPVAPPPPPPAPVAPAFLPPAPSASSAPIPPPPPPSTVPFIPNTNVSAAPEAPQSVTMPLPPAPTAPPPMPQSFTAPSNHDAPPPVPQPFTASSNLGAAPPTPPPLMPPTSS